MAPISQARIFESLGYHPHPAQARIHSAGGVRNRVVSAGRRIGKSTAGGNELVPEALRTKKLANALIDAGKRREFWIVGPEYSDAEKEFRVAYNSLRRLQVPWDKPGTYNNPESGQMDISLWDGAFQIHAKSAKHPETLVGEGLSGVIMAEAAKIKHKVWTKSIRPTLADFKGWALFTSTPEGRNWFYDLWRAGQDPNRKDWWSVRLPSWANPFVFPAGATEEGIAMLRNAMSVGAPVNADLIALSGVDPEIVDMLLDLTPESFNQEIGADFTEFVGRVMKEFDEEEHVRDLVFQPDWKTYGAVDYGFTNPNVWLLIQIDPFGERMHILDEIYESGLTAEEFANSIVNKGLCPPGTIAFYPDPAGPSDTRALEAKLRVRGMPGTGGPVKDRIQAIRNWLKPWPAHLEDNHPAKFPRLLVDRKCVNTIREFGDYRYPERRGETGPAPEEPMKKDDHTMEALGRLFAGMSATAPTRPRIVSARMGYGGRGSNL